MYLGVSLGPVNGPVGREGAVDIAELFDGIYRITLPTGFPVGSVNIYLFRDGESFDLLDAGVHTEESLSMLNAALVRLGLETFRLRGIYLTHAHVDHAGAVAPLMEKSETAVFLGGTDIPVIRANIYETFQSGRDDIIARYRRIGFPVSTLELLPSHSAFRTYRAPFVGSLIVLSGGESVRAGKAFLKVLAVPGHTPGSLCFYMEEERALFSGDTLLKHVTPNPGTFLFHEILASDRMRSNPLGDFLDSLKRLAQLDTVVAFPGHGKPITDPGVRINDYLLHHRRRLATIRRILDGRSLTCYEICEKLFGGSNDIDELVLQNVEVLAHLVYLIRTGTVVASVSDDGLTRYLIQ